MQAREVDKVRRKKDNLGNMYEHTAKEDKQKDLVPDFALIHKQDYDSSCLARYSIQYEIFLYQKLVFRLRPSLFLHSINMSCSVC